MLMHPTLFPVVSVVGLLSTCQNLNVSHAIGNAPFANILLQQGTLCCNRRHSASAQSQQLQHFTGIVGQLPAS